MLGTSRKVGRLYVLISLDLSSLYPSSAASTYSVPSLHLWHSRLGHASINRIRSLVSSGHLGIVSDNKDDCLTRPLTKQPALLFNNSTTISHALFDLVHSDIWGPSPNPTMGESKYFVIFVDDYSRYTWLFLMKQRSEFTKIYRDFAQMVKTQFSCPIKVFRIDNTMEYRDSDFLNLLQEHDTICQKSYPGTS